MASEVEVKFFTSKYSPFGQRVQVALTEKCIPFELILVNVANKPKLLLEANPIYKKYPVIIHNGKPVAESLVILEYLEDVWPEQVPLMPGDAFQRSQVRFWTDYIYKAFGTIWGGLRIPRGSPEKLAANEAAVHHLKTLDAAMTSLSANGPFFAGDEFGFVDVVLAPLCSMITVLEKFCGAVIPGQNVMPRLHKWIETVRVHSSVSSSVPSGEEALKYFLAIEERMAAAAAKASTQ